MILGRLKNLWKLSEFEPNVEKEQLPIGTKIIQTLIKKPTEKATFIPRIKITPAEQIINEAETT